jgi:hypothetical protein
MVNGEVVQVSGESLKLSSKPKSERPVEFARPPPATRPSAADCLMRSKQLIEALLSVSAPVFQSHGRHADVP